MNIRLIQHCLSYFILDFKGADFGNAHETDAGVLRQRLGLGQVGPGGEVGIDVVDQFAVQDARGLAAIVKADDGNVDVGAVQHPVLIGNRGEYVAGFLDALQRRAVGLKAYCLRRQQAGPARFAVRDVRPCLFQPVAAQVAGVGDAVAVQVIHGTHISVPQLLSERKMPQERRVANDVIHRRPTGFPVGVMGAEKSIPFRPGHFLQIAEFTPVLISVRGICGQIRFQQGIALGPRFDEFNQSVAAFNGIQRTQHRLPVVLVAVFNQPLQMAYPQRGAGQAAGVRVDLDAVELLRRHFGQKITQAQLRRQRQYRFLQIVQLTQRHVQKVAAAARRVQNPQR